eukprot:gene16761-23034_t
MERFITNFFLFGEVPLTLIGAFYALLAPVPFIATLLPKRLLPSMLSLDQPMTEIVTFCAQIYGLVLLLLALTELLIFLVKGQVISKKSLILPMAIADVIHIAVFAKVFLTETDGSWVALDSYKTWSGDEWTAFSTNIPLILVMLLLRIIYIAVAKPDAAVPSKKRV